MGNGFQEKGESVINMDSGADLKNCMARYDETLFVLPSRKQGNHNLGFF